MQLLKLELNGFKSFADKTEFEFERGVTAFVGPNGCGKSNVVDAVRWVLGEQSAKAVRGTAMEDVIFNGGGSRKPKGYAEASLTVLNDRGILPIDFTEVCITRRLYRSGDSEYLINRQLCRLRDIRELFMDTGVGMHAYSIIEQGKVARLLQANPKERRVVFEEAAGVSKYKAQRKAAQAKLERVQQNLERAQMLLAEKESRLRSIQYQAAKARRWQECQARLREIQILLGARRHRAAGRERAEVLARIAEAGERQGRTASRLAEADGSLAELERTTAELEQAHSAKQDEQYRVDSSIQAAEACIQRHTDLLGEYEAGIADARASGEAVEARLARTADELARARAEYEEISEAVRTQTARVSEQARQARELAAECDRLHDAIEQWKTEVIEIIHRSIGLRNEVNALLNSRRQDGARHERLAGRRREIEEEMARLAESDRALRERAQSLEARSAENASLRERTEAQRLEALGRVASADAELRALREREAALRERRQMLADLDASGEGVEEGVRWLIRAENRAAGVLGMVADLVHVGREHAAAIEAALGDRAQYVVAESTDLAVQCVGRLAESQAGRAGILALDRLRAPAGQAADLTGRPGVAGRASDLVRSSGGLEGLVRHLLADVWVVDSFASALALAQDGGRDVRLATLQGDLVEPGGALVGGGAARRTGIISRRSELEAVSTDLEDLAREIVRLETERGSVSERAQLLAAEVASLQADSEEMRRERHVVETDLQDQERQRARLEEQRQVLLAELGEIEENLLSFTAREDQIGRDLAACEGMKLRLEEEIRSAQERLQVQRRDAAQLRDEADQLRVALARKDEKRGNLETRVASLEKAAAELGEQLEGARGTISSYVRKRTESEGEIASSREQREGLGRRQAAIREELEALRRKRQATHEKRREVFDLAQALRAEHDAASRHLADLRVAENRHALELQAVEERLRADWNVSISEIASQAPAPESEAQDGEALAAEAADLQRKIQQMGGVNTDAVAEQEELEAQIKWQLDQREDLDSAEKQLRQIIRKINKICRERFEEAFAQVRANFQEMFRKLFGGGNAEMKLEEEDEEDMLEAGIDIVARPPGKEPKSIIQLSGGEQTMTTVALIFAIFKWKPSPFCILDEVDAALDEANIDRFCAIVREFLDQSQFIIITHSKRTMGLADVLYGITMMEQGVSTKLAVKVEEAA